MATCEKCKATLAQNEIYDVNGKIYCEDCAMTLQNNPSRRCGD